MHVHETIWCGFKPEFIPQGFVWGFTTGCIVAYKPAVNDEVPVPPNAPSVSKPKIIK